MKEKRYICVGENFYNDTLTGRCGEVHTLMKWVEILYPKAGSVEFFAGWSDKYIVEYLLKNRGVRLKRFKED